VTLNVTTKAPVEIPGLFLMKLKIYFRIVGLLLCLANSTYASKLSAHKQEVLETAAKESQDACYKQIYRDTNAYAQCIRNLREAKKIKPLEALGVTYFGFVGALSYMRVSQAGTDLIAYEFLQSAQNQQKALGIDDQAICSTVPGDCVVRLAQIKQLQASPPKPVPMRMQCVAGVCRLVPAQ
jgi:hypothetical protein